MISIREAEERCRLVRGGWARWEAGALPRDIRIVVNAIASCLGMDRTWLLDGGLLEPFRGRGARSVNSDAADDSALCPSDQPTDSSVARDITQVAA